MPSGQPGPTNIAQVENEATIRAILDTAVDAIIVIDSDAVIQSVNPAVEKLFGYHASEVVGKNVKILMPEPYRSEHDQYMQNYLTTGRRRIIGIGREVVGRRKDGTTFPLDLAVSEVRVPNRRLFAGIIRDLTERKRLEYQLLQISDREQNRIGQDLHDGLGQVLAGIGFMSKALEGRLTKQDSPEAGDAKQISDLVAQAISQARALSRGLHPVPPDPAGLMTSLQELADKVGNLFNTSIVFECDEPVLIPDSGVATHLYRIVQEATNNAIRHGKAKNVRITLKKVGSDTIRLQIEDNGSGIPAILPGRKGLGLQIMHSRAAVIGGAFSIRRAAPTGTIITCELKESSLQSAQQAEQRQMS